MDIANQITEAVHEIAACKRLMLDLRGNESGGLAFVRASYLTAGRRTIGYSVPRYGAEHGSLDSRQTFRWIPRKKKAALLWLALKYGVVGPPSASRRRAFEPSRSRELSARVAMK